MKEFFLTFSISLVLCLKCFSQIEGDVRSSDNKRISKAVIIAFDTAKNVIDSVISAENGFYAFKNLRPGKYFIEARAKGFESRIYKNIEARENLIDPSEGKDQSNATRLQIVLSPIKKQKQ
jgi:Carboxypeptidase regulatory-like domain